MCAPAGLAAVNGTQLHLPFLRRPQRSKVEIVIAQRGKAFAQLARAHVAVVVDDRGCLAGGAGKGPRSGLLKIMMLRAVVRCDRTDVGDVLNESAAGVIRSKHAVTIALREPGNVRVHPRQHLGRHLFDGLAYQRFASNDIEILTVQLEVIPQIFREHFDLCVVLSANDRVDV